MKQKTTKTKSKELTISSADLSRFGMGVMNRALKVVNTAKKVRLQLNSKSNKPQSIILEVKAYPPPIHYFRKMCVQEHKQKIK
jgi:hypothetical protein